jgi:hypothetical protein
MSIAGGHGRSGASGASCAHVVLSRSVATRANSAKSSAIPSGVLFRATARAAYSVAPAVIDTHVFDWRPSELAGDLRWQTGAHLKSFRDAHRRTPALPRLSEQMLLETAGVPVHVRWNYFSRSRAAVV